MNDPSLELKKFGISNIVANASLGHKVNLSDFSKNRYVLKNQKFPGVVYKGVHGLVRSVLVFATGKLVFTGAKSLHDVEEAYMKMQDTLSLFRVDDHVDIKSLSPIPRLMSERKEKKEKKEKRSSSKK